MAKRSDSVNKESLSGLLRHHPYLLLLQKEDWSIYLELMAQIYDLLEEQGRRVPIDQIRAVAIRYFSLFDLASVEQKASTFLAMSIGELKVLRDSHDSFGNRFIETTREGKALLQFMESLL